MYKNNPINIILHLYIYICMCICKYIYMNVYIHIYIYIHVHVSASKTFNNHGSLDMESRGKPPTLIAHQGGEAHAGALHLMEDLLFGDGGRTFFEDLLESPGDLGTC